MRSLTAPKTSRRTTAAPWVLGLVAALGLSAASGCGTVKSYRLPMSGSIARGTFAPLAACATQQHLEAVEHPDSFNVRFDPETWIQYMIQGEQYNMVILVGKGVPEPEREPRALAAKQKGDELFGCATLPPQQQVMVVPGAPGPDGNLAAAAQNLAAASMNMGAAAMNTGAAAMNQGAAAMNQGAAAMNTGAATMNQGTAAASPGGPIPADPCARLVACYAILARDFCQPGAQCQFKVEVKGNDPRACQSGLQQVPSTVQMLSMVHPGYVLPETCR